MNTSPPIELKDLLKRMLAGDVPGMPRAIPRWNVFGFNLPAAAVRKPSKAKRGRKQPSRKTIRKWMAA